jgi:Na+/melibiose symporter-like transporter
MKLRAMVGWSVGSFTSAALVGAVSLLHMRFMTDSLGIAIGVAGLLVVLSKVYDAILDPLMGVASDRTKTPWGRYRPYLIGGALLAAVSVAMLFNVPADLKHGGMIAWSCLSLLIYSTAYTMFRIPYLALGRAITQDFGERSRLMTFSVIGSSIGTMAATSAIPFLLAGFGSDRSAHALLAWLIAGFVAFGGIATFLLIDSESEESETQARAHFTLAEAWRAVAGNRAFRALIGFKVVLFSGLALHGAAIPYFTRHVLHATDFSLGSVFLMQTLTMMASQPIWVRVAGRIGRRKGLIAAAMIETLAILAWFLVPAGHPSPWLQVIGSFEGLALGGIMFGLYTMLSDTMDLAREQKDSLGQDGILAGVFVMIEKATGALGTFLFSTTMAWTGFISASDAGTVQPASVTTGIIAAIALIPAGAALLACLILREKPVQHAGAIAAILLAVTLIVLPQSRAEARDLPTGVIIKRIVAGSDGKSYLEDITLPPAAGTDPSALVSRLYTTDSEIGISRPGTFINWHRVSTPRLLVVLKGRMEVGLGNGRTYRFGPGDMVLAMDTTGQGHTSRMLGRVPVMAMTVRLPKDDPLRTRPSSCSDGISAQDCVANSLNIRRP